MPWRKLKTRMWVVCPQDFISLFGYYEVWMFNIENLFWYSITFFKIASNWKNKVSLVTGFFNTNTYPNFKLRHTYILWTLHEYIVFTSLIIHTVWPESIWIKVKKSLDFYYHSIIIHTQEAQNLYQLKSPLSDLTS